MTTLPPSLTNQEAPAEVRRGFRSKVGGGKSRSGPRVRARADAPPVPPSGEMIQEKSLEDTDDGGLDLAAFRRRSRQAPIALDPFAGFGRPGRRRFPPWTPASLSGRLLRYPKYRLPDGIIANDFLDRRVGIQPGPQREVAGF